MNVFNPLQTDSYILISDQPGIKRLRISDIPSCNRATKGNLVFKSPKTNQIHALTAFVLTTQDELVLETNQQHFKVQVKDYSYGQLLNKPSAIMALKDEQLVYVYNPKTLIADMIQKVKSDEHHEDAFQVIPEPELFEDIDETEKKVEPVIVQPLKKNDHNEDDKHFEPISFDDLFKEDF